MMSNLWKQLKLSLRRVLDSHAPPLLLAIQDQPYHLQELLKHDSRSAVGLYEDQQNPENKAIVKFYRRKSWFGFPMKHLGYWFAKREAKILQACSELSFVPRYLGPVFLDKKRLPNVCAISYIPGKSLDKRYPIDKPFVEKVFANLNHFHQKGFVHNDLGNRHNIYIDEQGNPCFIDFQLSLRQSSSTLGKLFLLKTIFKTLQRIDEYHVLKFFARHTPELLTETQRQQVREKVLLTRILACFRIPFLKVRRFLIRWIRPERS